MYVVKRVIRLCLVSKWEFWLRSSLKDWKTVQNDLGYCEIQLFIVS